MRYHIKIVTKHQYGNDVSNVVFKNQDELFAYFDRMHKADQIKYDTILELLKSGRTTDQQKDFGGKAVVRKIYTLTQIVTKKRRDLTTVKG